VDQLAKEILSSGEAYKKFLRYARPYGFREPEFASIKKILKPRNQVLSLKLTIEDLQKLQNWLVHHTIVKQECYLKHP
jgi:hypothetical protein